MIYKGPLKRRGGTQGDSGELVVFLLDHALLMVKQKNKAEQYKVYRQVRFASRPDSLIVMIYWSL
jgi:RHO1 GDP-GTP exchange protein 1/2